MKVIKLSATWCGPCKKYAPIFDKWAEGNPDVVTEQFDVDRQIIMKKWKIKNVPTTIMVDDNDDVIKRETGVLTSAQLDTFKIND